ncbi:MAG: hypothetical protein C4521_05175 [Actinobacteria bacterium]|nr:MAG: hypothetical protein C4521_05175 [Actinomycetota bacterium]
MDLKRDCKNLRFERRLNPWWREESSGTRDILLSDFEKWSVCSYRQKEVFEDRLCEGCDGYSPR